MEITSLSNKHSDTEILYDKLNGHREEFYRLCVSATNIIRKLKLIGKYGEYWHCDNGFKILTKNITDNLEWNGYKVVYVPDDIYDLAADFVKKLKGKVLIIGGGSWDRIILSGVIDLTHLIIACEFSAPIQLESTFLLNKKLESIIIYGQVYDRDHKLTETTIVNHLNETFCWCIKLKSIVMLGCNFDSIRSMTGTFAHCFSLKRIYIQNFKRIQLQEICSCFDSCYSIEELNLRSVTTDNVRTLDDTFRMCKSLKRLDISNFRTPKAFSFNRMFYGDEQLEIINMKHIKFDKYATVEDMFEGCTKLRKTGIPRIDIKLPFIKWRKQKKNNIQE